MAITVERLYELCEKLDEAKSNITQHTDDYRLIIDATKGGTNEKRLAGQLIVRFFHRFVDEQMRALDALFELCEDIDVNIRKVVIKELPALCKGIDGVSQQHVDKVADVLTQLLQTEDAHEQTIVQNALVHLLHNYPKDTLKTVFTHIMNGEEELIRERAIKFIAAKLKNMPSVAMTKEIEDIVLTESKKVLQDVTGDEFILFMYILQNLPHLQTVTGRQQLLQLVMEQADLDKAFQPDDADRIDQITQCFKQAIPYLSKNVQSTRLTSFLLENVVPNFDRIKAVSEGAELELLRVLAELSATTGELVDEQSKMAPLFRKLIETMPIPPSETNGSSATEASDNDDANVKFSHIEALMLTVHHLGRRHPAFFTSTDEKQIEERKEFKKRLQYLARVIQIYSKKLQTILAKQGRPAVVSEENKINFMALRVTTNISTLIKDLLRTPPQFKAIVAPSWKPTEKTAEKRRTIDAAITDEPTSTPARKLTKKDDRSIYTPPSGKFSEKAGTFADQANGGRGTGMQANRGRGGNRGRSRGRWSRRY